MSEVNYSLFKKICLISVLIVPIFIILGIFIDLVLFISIYIMIWLTIFGIWGGKWLWKALASADIFKSGMSIFGKIIGCIALGAFAIFIGIGFYLYYLGDHAFIRQIVQIGTVLMLFIVVYNVGYLISIWKPIKNKSEQKSSFRIKIKLSILVLTVTVLYVAGCFIAFLAITGEVISILFQYFAASGVGLALGWIFWEHLKETKMLSGDFLRILKILSIIFEAPIIVLAILGIISNQIQIIFLDKFILLGYLLLFHLMFAYFIGLLSETIKK